MMPYNINDYKPFRTGQYPVFTSSENGCRHIGNNTKRQYVRHFKVDGEVFRGPGEERCDYLLLNDEAATSYYIELKGSDLPKASFLYNSKRMGEICLYIGYPRG